MRSGPEPSKPFQSFFQPEVGSCSSHRRLKYPERPSITPRCREVPTQLLLCYDDDRQPCAKMQWRCMLAFVERGLGVEILKPLVQGATSFGLWLRNRTIGLWVWVQGRLYARRKCVSGSWFLCFTDCCESSSREAPVDLVWLVRPSIQMWDLRNCQYPFKVWLPI